MLLSLRFASEETERFKSRPEAVPGEAGDGLGDGDGGRDDNGGSGGDRCL